MRRLLTLFLGGIVVVPGIAISLSPAARTEIDGLISRLEASGCEINRNGTWHASADAKAHLMRKLNYLEEQGSVQSAEQFIELAASSSSTTGQPYLIKCGDRPPVPSGAWFSSQLQAMRSVRPAVSARQP